VGADRGTDPQGEGHIYAFDRITGKVRWKYLAAPGVSSDLLREGSHVVAYCQNGEMMSLDVNTGKLIWKMKVTEKATDYLPTAVLLEGKIFAGTLDGTLRAIDAETGDLLWKRDLDHNASLQPVAIEDELYVVSDARRLYAIDKKSGRTLKNLALEAAPSFRPAAAHDSIVLEFQDHTVRRIGIKKGVIWSQRLAADLTTHSPFLIGEDVLVADATGKVTALGLADGASRWSIKFPGLSAPITTITSDRNFLYVGTQGGTLYALSKDEMKKRPEK
jgi:outer membrane protein assembly factor BamB